jgi:hypothetical protein
MPLLDHVVSDVVEVLFQELAHIAHDGLVNHVLSERAPPLSLFSHILSLYIRFQLVMIE